MSEKGSRPLKRLLASRMQASSWLGWLRQRLFRLDTFRLSCTPHQMLWPPLQVVDRVVQKLALHSALEATLAAAPPELVADVLQHVRRQLSVPDAARHALGLADVLFNSCPASLARDEATLERLAQLRTAIGEELRTQEQLMVVAGMVAAVQQA